MSLNNKNFKTNFSKFTANCINSNLQDDYINSKIKEIAYFHKCPGNWVACEMVLENGFVVNGESGKINDLSREDNEEIAYKDARNKIFNLEGYLLQEKECVS